VPNTLLFDEEFGGFMGLIENFLQVIRGAELPAVAGLLTVPPAGTACAPTNCGTSSLEGW
jgi:hypothetical protein